MPSTHSKTDVYEQITNTIIAAIEAGAGKFEMPWHTLGSPMNATTRKLYRGINVLMLWAASRKHNYYSQQWATYHQWSEIGAQVRKEEHSTVVVFWKFVDSQTEEENHAEDVGGGDRRPRCFARDYRVFNANQVDGYEEEVIQQLPESERIENAQTFFRALPARIKYGGDRAYYSTEGDYIQMPPFAQFKSGDGYVSTLNHELSHWSGAKTRLNRDLTGRFGDAKYAMEELTAELSSSFLCAALHIRPEPLTDHAAYLTSWLTVLRNDKKAIFTAASKAQDAATYLQSLASLGQECA